MREISVSELRQLIDSSDSIHLVDVREPYEHEEFNIGGINMPLGELIQFEEELKRMSETGEIFLYCRSGNRSGMAQKLLAMRMNIGNTVNIIGGVVAWENETG